MFEELWDLDRPSFSNFGLFRNLLDEMLEPVNWLSDVRAMPRTNFPAINMGDTEDAIFVYAFVPGVDRKSLEVSIEGNLLTLHGTREAPETNEDMTWYRNERFAGEFTRSVSLPETVDPDQVEASLRHGVLSVKIRKRAESKPRRLEVKAA